MNTQPFRVIGIGAGFSPNLKANLYEAARLCIFFNAKLVLIHVGERTDEKATQLDEIVAPFKVQNLLYSIVFQPGEPVESIISATEKYKIDLLILGAAQRENIFKYYIGSIARKITREAKCSILLLIKPSVDRIQCEHIVVNGLEDARTLQTLDAAFYVANKLNASRITIVEEIRQQEVAVHVDDDKSLRAAKIKKEKISRREDYRVQQMISQVPDTYKKEITIKTQAIFGKRGYSIGHYAEVIGADLLVMNAPSKTNFWDRLFPHDIEHILTELPTDVLIIQ
ncbi:universal stress protein [uncultured Dokdonia sp.]|uniref:universal stress protein n=1 Tax=uncultured Dokdonia sp. TaxID=575653 RepID=UPI0026068CEB|nr:universal stress protein [uncultured Dokdonia sp.]